MAHTHFTRVTLRTLDGDPLLLRPKEGAPPGVLSWTNRGKSVTLDGYAYPHVHDTVLMPPIPLRPNGALITLSPGDTLDVDLNGVTYEYDLGDSEVVSHPLLPEQEQDILRGPDGRPVLTEHDLSSLNPRQRALIQWLADANRQYRNLNLLLFACLTLSMVINLL